MEKPTFRSVPILQEELALNPEVEELCLHFKTPGIFPAKESRRYWLVEKDLFIESLYRRIETLFAITLCPESDTQEIRLLPYYWQKVVIQNTSRSNANTYRVEGLTGPLYIRGPLASLLPLLAACSELHLGLGNKAFRNGFGYYTLHESLPFFDARLQDRTLFDTTVKSILEHSDIDDKLNDLMLDKTSQLTVLYDQIAEGRYTPRPATGFYIGKRGGGKRLIVHLEPEDQLAQKFLHALLAPVMDHFFEHASIGFRAGRSREDAANMISSAFQEGFTHIVESDIAAFFDSVDWSLLEEKVNAHLPLADTLTRALLQKSIMMPLIIKDCFQTRNQGLLQGSPLSPLLANLYLDSLDEEMARRGFRLIRYADDFVFLTHSREESLAAMAAIKEELQRLGLALGLEKAKTTRLDDGFTFLGLSFSPGLDRRILDSARPAKTLFITNRYLSVGIDCDAISLKKNKALLGRIPLRQVEDIIILGSNSLSTRLLHRCASEKIPVSFCTPFGHYRSTVLPSNRKHHLLNGRHLQRHDGLSEEQKLSLVKDIVCTKINNYLYWFRQSWPASEKKKRTCRSLEHIVLAIIDADFIEAIRGHEGRAAKICFRGVNERAKSAFFHSTARIQRKRADAWNSLLDFSYSLLFTRLNVLLRSRGLNPYLGLLHSDRNHYPSLVADLQEPFRCRIDRFLLRLINLKIISEKHFEEEPPGRWSLTREGISIILEQFEQEMSTRFKKDEGTFRQLLIAQVHAVELWVGGDAPFRLYGADRHQQTYLR